jgi:hypothetical protein
MRLHFKIASVFFLAALLVSRALPQSSTSPDAKRRSVEYVRFLVDQLDQWTRDFPQAYNLALMHPPVDLSKISSRLQGGADQLRSSVAALAVAGKAADPLTDKAFRTTFQSVQVAATAVNQSLSMNRFPDAVQNDWANIRTTLNSLAGILKETQLAVLEPPAPGTAGAKSASAPPAGALVGYVVDQKCALRGKAMWVNAQCVQTCVRDGDKIVLVSEDGKVTNFANPDKIDAETYGRKIAVTGKVDGDTVTVAGFQIL